MCLRAHGIDNGGVGGGPEDVEGMTCPRIRGRRPRLHHRNDRPEKLATMTEASVEEDEPEGSTTTTEASAEEAEEMKSMSENL